MSELEPLQEDQQELDRLLSYEETFAFWGLHLMRGTFLPSYTQIAEHNCCFNLD